MYHPDAIVLDLLQTKYGLAAPTFSRILQKRNACRLLLLLGHGDGGTMRAAHEGGIART